MKLFFVVTVCCLLIVVVVARERRSNNRITSGMVRIKRNSPGDPLGGDVKGALCSQNQKLVNTLRGGFDINDLLKPTKAASTTGSTDVVVATSIGSVFLDKKKKLSIGRNETVHDLKVQISKKFPGSPPAALQKLYFISRMLNDTEKIGNISVISPIPIVLDMVSGTSVYNRNMSISQALEAYAASVVQQSYLGAQLQQLYDPDSNETQPMTSPRLRELFHSINTSIYEQYGDDIAAAKQRESEPERATDDTAAWRTQKTVSPLTAAIAKEFDLNWRGVRQYAFYSLVLIVFSYFGTATPEAAALLLYLIPVLWISKLRQLRLIFKIALNLALPVIYNFDFLMPMLPAPLQVIAQHSAESVAAGLDGEDENGDESPLESSAFASINTAVNKIVAIGRSSLSDLVSGARVLLNSISASALSRDDADVDVDGGAEGAGEEEEEEGGEANADENGTEDSEEGGQEGEEQGLDGSDDEIELDYDAEEVGPVDEGAEGE